MATGTIITTASLTLFLGATNLAVLSQQDNTASTPNDAVVQSAINTAEARVYGTLGQLQCSSGTFFKMPFTVGGVAILSATTSIGFNLLQVAAHQYAGFLLNRWRAIQSTPEDEAGLPAIYRVARSWEKDADGELQKIIRWAQGFTDGQYVNLDLNTGAVVGQIYRRIAAPTFAMPCVGPDGLPFIRIVNASPFVWPVSPYVTFPFGVIGE